MNRSLNRRIHPIAEANGLSPKFHRKTNTNHFYINNDYRKLDRANRMVIDYVEGKIELD